MDEQRGRFRFDRFQGLTRFALVGLIGGLASACSSESTRLAGTSFSNPFGSTASAKVAEPVATGSLSMPTAPVQSAPLGSPVQSQPIAVARAVPAAPVQPVAPAKPSGMAAARGPAGWSAAARRRGATPCGGWWPTC